MSRVVVFAPIPLLTITIEPSVSGPGEVHLHAGGQGIWVARMARALSSEAIVCTTLGGESGRVLRPLIDDMDLEPRIVAAREESGVYVHDRRSGQRVPLIERAGGPLHRHEADELYGATLAAALGGDALLLTGVRDPGSLDLSIYGRLARDVRANGRLVLADLVGPALSEALAGGVDVVKISDQDLVEDGPPPTTEAELLTAAEELRSRGAGVVVVSRDAAPTVVAGPAGQARVTGPRFDPVDPTGGGDSMFAALGVAMAAGRDALDAARLAVAAGALNVTRHGLGTGNRRDIEALSERVSVEPATEPVGRR
jgi:1-phosphofructokinase